MKKHKLLTTTQKIEYLLVQLNKNYSIEKTEEDYEKFLKGLTPDRELIDRTLKEWEEVLSHLE